MENSESYSIKLKKIIFDKQGFRKLKNLEIHIADRLTAIGGLNGIGKSTLLGLLANASGISGRRLLNSKSKEYSSKKSYFDLPYQANFQELFHLDNSDYTKSPQDKGAFELHYEYASSINTLKLVKKCNVTRSMVIDTSQNSDEVNVNKKHSNSKKSFYRYRIVPRSTDLNLSKDLDVGADAKVPIPTIYLGMSRTTPMGEINFENIKKRQIKNIPHEDLKYFSKLFTKIVKYDLAENQQINDFDFKESKKKFKILNLKHNPLSISLGQDSLSAIFTALVSFYSLKREHPNNYAGGILIIDEIDTGLHHSAQESLINLLQTEARNLDLQIIFTTHSLTIFKKLLDTPLKQNQFPDKVVYLKDTHTPRLMNNPNYLMIKNSQLATVDIDDIKYNNIKIYFEDDEALWFYEQLLLVKQIVDPITAFSVNLTPISLKVSCLVLLQLIKADDLFKDVILILDNDVTSEATNRDILLNNKNIIALPGNTSFNINTASKLRSPERILYEYLSDKYENYDNSFWSRINEINNGAYDYDYIGERLLTLDFDAPGKKDREILKTWFNKHKFVIENMELISFWVEENQSSVDEFISSFKEAIKFIINKKDFCD